MSQTDLSNKLSRIPRKTGVYIFRDKAGTIIYIGKAKTLRNRIRSYFTSSTKDIKTQTLVGKIADVEWIVLNSEAEALIMEANLIKQYRPRYNIDLKDDKHYPYLEITKEPFPRVRIVRRKRAGGEYFGPYSSARSMRRLYRIAMKHFRIRPCTMKLPAARPIKPCLYYQLGQCDAPCAELISEDDYAKGVEQVRLFLKGKRRELTTLMRNEMKRAAEELRFESAKLYRDAIAAVEKALEPQKVDAGILDRDIMGAAMSKHLAVIALFRVREGAIIGNYIQTATISANARLAELVGEFLSRYYLSSGEIPKEILVQITPPEMEFIADSLSQIAKHKVRIVVPRRGLPLGLLKLARQNARLRLSELLLQSKKEQVSNSIIELRQALGLSSIPKRIEGFDISNLGESFRVASMVSFINGRANKKGYRRFKIKTVEGQDDFASIGEVVFRRYKRILDEKKSLPDLILIDGGRGQLSSAVSALQNLDIIDKVEVAALAKRNEEIYLPQYPDPVVLAKDSDALHLLMRIRDEAHRFAITYHRLLRSKSGRASLLLEIDGIGEKRQKQLLEAFESLDEMASATPSEIAERASVPSELAKKVLSFLKGLGLGALIAISIAGCVPKPRYRTHPLPVAVHEPSEKLPPPAAHTTKTKQNGSEDSFLGVINYYLGTPYRYGGTTHAGMDCSGFVQVVYRDGLGIKLPRTVREQIKEGRRIPQGEMAFGDLLFFKMKHSHPDHIGIYLGGGRFAHASSSQGVTISSLVESYYSRRLAEVRRVLNWRR